MANNDIIFSYGKSSRFIKGGKKPVSNKKGANAFDQKAYRREVSRLSAIANKRTDRLANANLTTSPAFDKWFKDGQVRFGVKGKSFNEVQSEMARLNKFLNSTTSTIRGYNRTLREIASNTGIKFSNMKQLQAKAGSFFALADKVEQYLRTVEDIASAIGYNQIWEVINTYTQENKLNLGAETDVDGLVETISQILAKGDERKDETFGDWTFLTR